MKATTNKVGDLRLLKQCDTECSMVLLSIVDDVYGTIFPIHVVAQPVLPIYRGVR